MTDNPPLPPGVTAWSVGPDPHVVAGPGEVISPELQLRAENHALRLKVDRLERELADCRNGKVHWSPDEKDAEYVLGDLGADDGE